MKLLTKLPACYTEEEVQNTGGDGHRASPQNFLFMTYNPTTILTTKMQNDFDCCDAKATEQLRMLSSEIYQNKHTVKTLKKTQAYT